jgi:hypothetical protein
MTYIDTPAAGTYTYTIAGKKSTASNLMLLNAYIIAYEI